MNRSEILWRLRQALRDHPKIPLLPEPTPSRALENPVDTFTLRLEEAGGTVFDARKLGFQECLNRVLKKTGADEIFWEDPDVLVTNGIPHEIRGKNAFDDNELVFSSHSKGAALPIVLNVRPLALHHIESAKPNNKRILRLPEQKKTEPVSAMASLPEPAESLADSI